MSKSFYKYIAKDLIIEWFKNNRPSNGSRYYMVIEDTSRRNAILEALQEYSDKLTVNGIYEGADIPEEEYDTYALKIAQDSPKLIIGNDNSASEDYLTTLRNSIGKNGKYKNYGVLYILSTNVLSSLATASSNLENPGYALHPSHVVNKINKDIKTCVSKDLERLYLEYYLETISALISDGVSTFFDFEPIMQVLGAGSIKGLFNKLEMFEDKSIYDNAYRPNDKEVSERAAKNKYLYARISAIMDGDEENKAHELEKFLDVKLAKKIAKPTNDWRAFDLQDFIYSENIKAQTDNLRLINITLNNQREGIDLIWNYSGKLDKSSKNYIVICDQTYADTEEISFLFNKPVKIDSGSSSSCHIRGTKVIVKLHDDVFATRIGYNDNRHDFFILKLNCPISLFRDIRKCFSLNKKGELTVKVPDEVSELRFGDGDSEGYLNLQNEWVWSVDETLAIPTEDSEEDKLIFTVKIGEKSLKVTLKLNSAKPVPPLGPDSFPPSVSLTGIEVDGEQFAKVTDGDIERPVYKFWRKFLKWEKAFIDGEYHSLNVSHNDLTDNEEIEGRELAIPHEISKALNAIYDYFKTTETIPSLSPISPTLQSLYKNYCDAVVDCVSDIPTNKSLEKQYHNLTVLGTVYDGTHLYLSPFHPLIVAYLLELQLQSQGEVLSYAKKLLTPFYLIPYLTYKNAFMRPYSNSQLEEIKNWLIYEKEDSEPQERANDITKKMVVSKMDDFIKNFPHLFQDYESPIVISAIGLAEDANLIKGLVEFIKAQLPNTVQRVELHEYVSNLGKETFFEKLNRLGSIDNIERELKGLKINLESKGNYTGKDIIHQLFTRVSFYKHELSQTNPSIGYCHIAFYQMDTGSSYITPPSNEARTELAFNGLISVPSTLKKNGAYQIGFGIKGVDVENMDGFIHPMSLAYNNLFGNEKNDGANTYTIPTAVTKRFEFKNAKLLNSIYENANWVTFLNPEVDINFFYKQDVYVVHYTDQYSINAKYDSITVTKHIGLYDNLLKKSYESLALSEDLFPRFNKTMKNYFNCLNGRWLLRLVNQPELKVRERMSLVATSVVMQKLLHRNANIIWIPISLEEILRVTGEIGLKMDGIFAKKTLGAKGSMSDDLLMLGIDPSDKNAPKLYFYPIEVKVSNSSSQTVKGRSQVAHTWKQFKEHLFKSKDEFETKIRRTFFASQLLTNAEKLYANDLLPESNYEQIERCRYALLNLKWSHKEVLPVKELGVAAVVSFFSTAPHSISTKLVEGVPVCEVHFSQNECLEYVANPSSLHLEFLTTALIDIDEETLNVINSPSGICDSTCDQGNSVVADLEDDDDIPEETTTSPISKESIHIQSESSQQSNDGDSDQSPSGIDSINQQDTNQTDEPEQQISPIKVIVGSVKNKSQKILFEPNNTEAVSHPNMGIIGTMGTGKTQFARSVIAQLSKESVHNVGGEPVGLLVFDYKGDYKDKAFLETIDGNCYKSNYPFNPLKLIINDDVEGMNLPAITADKIADSFAKAYGLGLKQQSNIKQVIIATYEDAGITRDASTWSKRCPTMNDVIRKYFDTYDANDKAYALFDKLNDYTIFTDDVNQCVSMFEWLNGVRVIDLTLYPDDTKKVIVSLILDLFYAEMRQLGSSKLEGSFRELRAMILVDEAHQFLKKDFNSFRSIISEGRMFGVGMILSTQNISDFKTAKEDYSQFILSWVIHHVNSISRSELTTIFGATDTHLNQYMDYISNAQKFESVCKIGHQVYGVKDFPYFQLIEEDTRFKNPSAETSE